MATTSWLEGQKNPHNPRQKSARDALNPSAPYPHPFGLLTSAPDSLPTCVGDIGFRARLVAFHPRLRRSGSRPVFAW